MSAIWACFQKFDVKIKRLFSNKYLGALVHGSLIAEFDKEVLKIN